MVLFKKLTVYIYMALKNKQTSWVIFLIYFHSYFQQSRGDFESWPRDELSSVHKTNFRC